MQLDQFNQSCPTQLKQFLTQCVNIPRWADELSAARPFSSVTTALDYAQQQSQTWLWSEIHTALNTHPRIGEKQAQHALSAQEQQFSQREQAHAQHADAELSHAIAQANAAYEQRFGYLFLIKASGLTADDILTALNYRLLNDVDTERRIVKQQLSEIALLRLTQELSHD